MLVCSVHWYMRAYSAMLATASMIEEIMIRHQSCHQYCPGLRPAQSQSTPKMSVLLLTVSCGAPALPEQFISAVCMYTQKDLCDDTSVAHEKACVRNVYPVCTDNTLVLNDSSMQSPRSHCCRYCQAIA